MEKEEMEKERLERLRIHRKGLENSRYVTQQFLSIWPRLHDRELLLITLNLPWSWKLCRMAEQEAQRNKNKPKPGAPRSVNVAAQRQSQQGPTKAKEQSGGMRASLNDDGKLIWE